MLVSGMAPGMRQRAGRTLCCEGDVELQHCLSTQGDGGTSANPQMFCCQKQVCMSCLMPGHPGAFST